MLPLLAAVIISNTVSNSSTGGNVVSSGGDVVNGSSYSSVSVQTYDNSSGGTSTVQVETDNNGQVNQQTYTKTIPAGGSADIYVATSTPAAPASTTVSTIVYSPGLNGGFQAFFTLVLNWFHFW